MEKALRMISVERGHDPRDFALVGFGGAGPLHACALARALRIPRVMIPASGSTFCDRDSDVGHRSRLFAHGNVACRSPESGEEVSANSRIAVNEK